MIKDFKLLKDLIQWDIINWGNCLGYWDDIIKSEFPLKCLEIGTGNGGLSLWATLHNHNVVCSDVLNPGNDAIPLHNKYNVTNKIEYKQINVLDIPYSGYFDIVIAKSILPVVGLNNRKDLQIKAIESIYNCLKPGGKYLFAENLRGTFLHKFARQNFVLWGKTMRYLDINEIPGLLKDFSSIKSNNFGYLGCFGKMENLRTFLGIIDTILNPMIPEDWKYIIIGIATK